MSLGLAVLLLLQRWGHVVSTVSGDLSVNNVRQF